MKDLNQCRSELDSIDAQLVGLFEKRMQIARDVALYKHRNNINILDSARENQVLESRAAQLRDEALKKPLTDFFREIMRLSREEQSRCLDRLSAAQTVAYCGIPGAYSESAAIGFFGKESERAHYRTFEEVFDAVVSGEVKYGVLPVENSSSGSINLVYDLLKNHACYIVGEQLVRVEHCLLGVPGTKLEDIKAVYSHEQGFRQCSAFLSHHPDWAVSPYFNTAIAARHVAELGDKRNAAIASRLAAERYKLEILEPDIHSYDGNHTRFIVVSASPASIDIPDKATITFVVRHERGSLMYALSHFAAMGMNLTHIEPRPLHENNWEYCFYADVTGKIEENTLRVLMESLSRDCENCRLLGAYKAAVKQ